jgi:Tat protein secretion system quality control protein TatD with DNase activity
MQEDNSRSVVYANEAAITVSGSDAVITFRWTLPKYNEANEIVGKITETETIVSMSTTMLKKHADSIIDLLKNIPDSNIPAS